MATFRLNGVIEKFEKKLIKGMTDNGYELDFAQRIFKQLKGFGSYGFPESHAASFALLVYVSSYLKCYYPDVFAGALLNSMPMGFYQPAQIVSDARAHHVEVRPVDINHSCWDNTLEEKETPPHALRLGFRQVKGLNQEEMDVLLSARKKDITSILALREAGVSQTALEKLADADAFRSIGLDRRRALWEISSLHDRPIGLFTGQASESTVEQPVELPEMSAPEHVVQDYNALALSLKAHPVSFVREKLSLLHVTAVKDLATIPDGMPVKVAGLVLVRQRPGTASGVCFITIEDETGCANLVVFNQLFEKYRKEILQSRLLMVEGKMQREGEVVHVVVRQCYNLNKLLHQMTAVEDATVKQAEIKAGTEELKLPGARNFR
jgi:error-prone DNA polymerase